MKNETFGFGASRWIAGGMAFVLAIGVWIVAKPAVARTFQQMEMRRAEQFDAEQFAKAKPAVGERAPELTLKTFGGESVELSSYLGKNVVVIKAGYT